MHLFLTDRIFNQFGFDWVGNRVGNQLQQVVTRLYADTNRENIP